MKQQKKAQVQMGETVAVIFIVMILIALGFVFYASISKGTHAKNVKEIFEKKARSTAEAVLSMPELDCSINGEKQPTCIDEKKAEAFENLTTSNSNFKEYYYDLLGFSKITLKIMDINGGSFTESTLYSKIITDFKTKSEYQMPVAVYDGMENGNEIYLFGILFIDVYQ